MACRLEALAFQQVPARFATALIELSERYGKVTATGVPRNCERRTVLPV